MNGTTQTPVGIAAPDDTFHVDMQYMLNQLQKENAELHQQATLQRAAFEQLKDSDQYHSREARMLQEQLDDATVKLAHFETFKASLRDHGFDPDVFVEEMNNGNLGGSVLRVGKRIVEANISREGTDFCEENRN